MIGFSGFPIARDARVGNDTTAYHKRARWNDRLARASKRQRRSR
jgi:hypothetical protein